MSNHELPSPNSANWVGHYAYELAHDAHELEGYLGEDLAWVPGQPLEWERPDRLALDVWFEFDSGIPLLEVPLELTGNISARLFRTVLEYHTALPFTEAERGWLHTVYRQASPHRADQLHHMLEHHTGSVMAAGIRRPVSGHDLMSRWLAWRRQTDEYQGQDSLDQTREALKTLGDLLRGE